MRGVKANVFTDNQGGFVFRSLAPGSYQVIVEGDRTLWETTAASVEVFPGAPAILTIVLRERKASANSGGGAISATELEVSVPPRARKEFERAIDAGLEGKAEESILHLRKAIEYYPGYLMAHNDLGAQLLEQGKLVEAEAELRTAIGIDPKAFNPHLNLGIVLVKNKRYLEAKEILTEAVSQVSNSPSARLYLGQALEGLNELPAATKEFITTFELGGDDYAIALFHLGNVYLKTGDRSGARKAFERYVAAAPRGPNVGEAKRQIALLQ
jgi:tetratricopeptide (TPR) repeat protein